ncbi:MAG: DUF4136 domain-containing protein [Rhodothalassiaceae bacterium]
MSLRTSALLLVALLGLAACAKTFEADVSRFHRLAAPQAETVRIVPADPAKVGSLEFAQYAALVRAQLIDAGYRPVAENPAILAKLDWTVSEGREKIRSYPGYYPYYPYYGFGHYGFGYFSHGHFPGYYGYGGYGEVYSTTVHTVSLNLRLERPTGEVLFEGRAVSDIGRPDLPAVMPYLVQALFTDFPGESGRTQTVELKLPDKDDVGY